ncbi:CPBP family intramembrane glutamic endopeptidase [Hydrogenivirga caldilitoris]|nr:CPBP family intramembrane glutamic endopeptidase [Hydrogenivirga caldilitoris]
MRGRLLAYGGLLAVLFIAKLSPQLNLLPPLYMIAPLFLIPEEKLGFRNYGKGALYGSLFLPLLLIAPPELSCPGWILNQLGISISEEVFFRGFMMGSLGNLKTSFLFSLAHLIHFPTLNSLLVFFPSLIFGYAYIKSGSILTPILLHFTANLFYHSLVKEFPELYHILQRQLTGS